MSSGSSLAYLGHILTVPQRIRFLLSLIRNLTCQTAACHFKGDTHICRSIAFCAMRILALTFRNVKFPYVPTLKANDRIGYPALHRRHLRLFKFQRRLFLFLSLGRNVRLLRVPARHEIERRAGCSNPPSQCWC
jgi:hypothetical protein